MDGWMDDSSFHTAFPPKNKNKNKNKKIKEKKNGQRVCGWKGGCTGQIVNQSIDRSINQSINYQLTHRDGQKKKENWETASYTYVQYVCTEYVCIHIAYSICGDRIWKQDREGKRKRGEGRGRGRSGGF